MAQGFRVRNPNTGAIMLDITDRITRTMGTFETGVVDGSFQITDGVGGQAWLSVLSDLAVTSGTATPEVTLSGNTISWSFRQFPWTQGRRSVLVIYGTY